MNYKRDKSCLMRSMLNLNPKRPLSSFSEESAGRYFQNRTISVLKHEKKVTPGNPPNPCGQPLKRQKPEFSNFSCRNSKPLSSCWRATCPRITPLRGKAFSENKVALKQRHPVFNPFRGFLGFKVLIEGKTGKQTIDQCFRLLKFISLGGDLSV